MRPFVIFASAAVFLAAPAPAQDDPTSLMAEQRAAMSRLDALDGVWRGEAWSMTPGGRHQMVQTERVGSFLDGSVKVVEGRGYEQDGKIGFNALGIISFDPATGAYALSSWAQGRQGRFPLRLTDSGYVWEVPAGPGAVIRYTAHIADGVWHEVGERIAGDGPPQKLMEMTLRRVGETDWPSGSAVPAR